jgi:class 3 adenylate cyclase
MVEPHVGPGGRTFIGTVVFLDIVGYSRTTVTQQVELKTAFNAVLAEALHHVGAAERVVLDTGDGAAVCFLGDPEDALFAANTMAQAAARAPGPAGLSLRIGVNLGPVKVVKDINGNPNILGDGINDAQRVMSFAEPNQILVSRSFFEVVSRLSQEYAQLFQFAGVRKDKHIREHEVYVVALAGSRGVTEVAVADPYQAVGPMSATSESETSRSGEAAGRPPETETPVGLVLGAETLNALVAALAQELGPVAKLLVRRAAVQADDLDGLAASLVANVPDPVRGKVSTQVAAILGRPAASAGSLSVGGASSAPAAPAGGRGLDAEALSQAESRLAHHIGPLARILVRNAARHAGSAAELYRSLGVHIEDAAARAAFIDSANH